MHSTQLQIDVDDVPTPGNISSFCSGQKNVLNAQPSVHVSFREQTCDRVGQNISLNKYFFEKVKVDNLGEVSKR